MEHGDKTVVEDCSDLMVERWLGEHAENGKTVLEMVADVEEAGWPGSVPKGIVEERYPPLGSLFPSGTCLACLGEETVYLRNGPLSFSCWMYFALWLWRFHLFCR